MNFSDFTIPRTKSPLILRDYAVAWREHAKFKLKLAVALYPHEISAAKTFKYQAERFAAECERRAAELDPR